MKKVAAKKNALKNSRSEKKAEALAKFTAPTKANSTAQSPERLLNLLKQMSQRRILVIGDVGIDRYTYGDVERISPEAPVPIVWVKSEQLKLGLAANVADNVRALGGQCSLVGVIGRDRFSEDFKSLLRKIRVDSADLVTDPSRRTIVKERVLSERQQLLRIDYESHHAVGSEVEGRLLARVKKLLGKCDIVVLQDYAKGMLSQKFVRELMRLAKAAGKSVAVDPNVKSDLGLYEGASFLTPNLKEAEKLAGLEIKDNASLKKAGRKILVTTGADHVVITRGKDGMAIFSRDEEGTRLIPTYAREVYDVSGAGDTVITIMSLAMGSGASIEEASMLGNLGAGIVVGKRGTATVTQAEIRKSIELLLK